MTDCRYVDLDGRKIFEKFPLFCLEKFTFFQVPQIHFTLLKLYEIQRNVTPYRVIVRTGTAVHVRVCGEHWKRVVCAGRTFSEQNPMACFAKSRGN